ncbi:MAG: glutathione S-transferase family protein [Alphaproteobacteria bacterium]|nr:glutathione S-transferase family protein [Alphaproteobacteria bacterium]
MLKLHHAPQSRSTRILWLLEELGADCEISYTSIARMDGSGGEDENNPHPDKKVPALVDRDQVITESAAIVLYLTDLYPEAGLGPLPGDPRRGEYLTWLFYYSGVVEPVVSFEFAGLGDHPALIRTFRGRAELDRRLLDALKTGPYLLGQKFSGVDILVASMGAWARQMLPTGKVMDEYLARCNARPALKASYAKDAPRAA